AVNGKTFHENPESYRNQMAYIPEMPILYDELTLYEHLRLTAMAYGISEELFEQRLEPLLKEFRMEKRLKWFPTHFSKGMRQKVMIMCAFLIELVKHHETLFRYAFSVSSFPNRKCFSMLGEYFELIASTPTASATAR